MRLARSLRKRWLALRLLLGFPPDYVCRGVRVPYRLALNGDVRRQLSDGVYELHEATLVEQHLPPGKEVLELGACIGVVSSLILSLRPVRLVSVEAMPSMADAARQVVALNHRDAPWELVVMAVGPAGVSEADFRWSPDLPLSGTVMPGDDMPVVLRVPVRTLAELTATHSMPRDAWLVMDIEGVELELAKNQRDALRHYAGIIAECHDTSDDSGPVSRSEVVRAIESAGFALVRSLGATSVFLRLD